MLVLISVANIFCTSSVAKWTILSGSVVPLLMNSSISPEFAQIVFTAGDSITNGITPLLVFFVVYLAFLEKFNQGEMVTMRDGIKYMLPYSAYTAIIMVIVVVGWYMLGVPIGIGSFPSVIYGA